MRSWISLLVFLIFCAEANGAQTQFSAKIVGVYPLPTGTEFVLTFDTDSPSCTNASKYHYVRVGENSITQEGLRNLLAAALAAASAGRSVTVWFNDATPNCFVNRMFVRFN